MLAVVYAAPRARLVAVVVSLTVASLVTLSRVYLRVHWLTDVIGGATMGVARLAGCNLVWLLRSSRGGREER